MLIEAICQLSQSNSIDPLTDPAVLSAAVTEGFLDAPQLLNNPHGRGEISTMIDHRGACVAVEKTTGKSITEKDRVLQRL